VLADRADKNGRRVASQICVIVIRRMKEGNSVVAAAPSLRPSAEWSPLIAQDTAR
jgi:hypothetical protein